MRVDVVACPGCGRDMARWGGALFELRAVPAGSQWGRGIVVVRVPGGGRVVDVRSLRSEPASCYPQHLCSEYLARRGSLRRSGA